MKKTYSQVMRLLNEFADETYDEQRRFDYATGYMQSMLAEVLSELPVKKQKLYMDQLQGAIDNAKYIREISLQDNMTFTRI